MFCQCSPTSSCNGLCFLAFGAKMLDNSRETCVNPEKCAQRSFNAWCPHSHCQRPALNAHVLDSTYIQAQHGKQYQRNAPVKPLAQLAVCVVVNTPWCTGHAAQKHHVFTSPLFQVFRLLSHNSAQTTALRIFFRSPARIPLENAL